MELHIIFVCGGRDYGRNPAQPTRANFPGQIEWERAQQKYAEACNEAKLQRERAVEAFERAHKAFPDAVFMSGGASGADTLAEIFAKQNDIPFLRWPAKWGKHGRSAGPIRNSEMIKLAVLMDCAIAFSGGKGTEHMVSLLEKADVPTERVE